MTEQDEGLEETASTQVILGHEWELLAALRSRVIELEAGRGLPSRREVNAASDDLANEICHITWATAGGREQAQELVFRLEELRERQAS